MFSRSVIDDSGSIIDDSRSIIDDCEIVVSLTDISGGVIYYHNVFMIQATGTCIIKHFRVAMFGNKLVSLLLSVSYYWL
jgi:hypothetical protein